MKFHYTKLSSVGRMAIVALFLIFSAVQAKSQCTIQSNDEACVGEVVQFTATVSSGTIGVVNWEFGDNGTATGSSVSHQYTTGGSYTVKATIQIINGVPCTITKNITIYNNPQMNVVLDASTQYCLLSNKICLQDNSTSGNAGIGLSKRIVLWGDGGKTETNSPTVGEKHCYTYIKEGKYSLTIEDINAKGCSNKQTINIEILDEFNPSFFPFSRGGSCKYEDIEFVEDTGWNNRYNLLQQLIFDYADGTTDTINAPISGLSKTHRFTKSGTYQVLLTAKFKNGCTREYIRNVIIDLDAVDVKIKKSDSIICVENSIEFFHAELKNADYSWAVFDSVGNVLNRISGDRIAYLGGGFGKNYVELTITKGVCESKGRDSFEGIGVALTPRILNNDQCGNIDSVIFCGDFIGYKNSNDLHFLWNLGYHKMEQCTTDYDKGINLNRNCITRKGQYFKHRFDTTICAVASLFLIDSVTKCYATYAPVVPNYSVINTPEPKDFEFLPRPACFADAVVLRSPCVTKVNVIWDSLCNSTNFDTKRLHEYYSTCDTSRWVTTAVAFQKGDSKVYRSCDPTDFYVDSSRVCIDTFWYHRAFQLQPKPSTSANYKLLNCIPGEIRGKFNNNRQQHILKVKYDWGDGAIDSFTMQPGYDTLPDFYHKYARSGTYAIGLSMISDSGCMSESYIVIKVGFYNNFEIVSPICPGITTYVKDSIRYWDDNTPYWNLPGNVESVKWDLGDGKGFSINGPFPGIKYDYPGTYNITMVSTDRNGCTDTVVKQIEVLEFTAGIKDLADKIICDEIVQLFDSTPIIPNDKVKRNYWSFGDNTRESVLKDPFHYYSIYGSFEIMHVVETQLGCIDTTYKTIVIEGPVAHFDIVSDTVGCAPFTAEFKNNSIKASDFIWYFGDNSANNTLSTQSTANVTHTYTKPGTYEIYLYASDSVYNPHSTDTLKFCSGIFPDSTQNPVAIRRIIVLPIPIVDFEISGGLCEGDTITLKDKSDPIYTDYKWQWAGGVVSGNNPEVKVQMNDTGSVTILYTPTYTPQGIYQRACFDSAEKVIEIKYNRTEFNFTKDSLCPIYTFTADGDDLIAYSWDFGHPASGDSNVSNLPTPHHSFYPDLGDFEVCLTTKNVDGCINEYCELVESEHSFTVFTPNILTPNDDDLNDVFYVEVEGSQLFELYIYNRWGEKVYEVKENYGKNTSLYWNGKVMNSGKPCPPGTYFYILKVQEGCNEEADIEKIEGVVTLFRD
ncbi:MAG: PKD domain-containing protein [Flavobacteriales bacterium]|nr:PKD domain-containing protein [Flavobacteriales bacterium]